MSAIVGSKRLIRHTAERHVSYQTKVGLISRPVPVVLECRLGRTFGQTEQAARNKPWRGNFGGTEVNGNLRRSIGSVLMLGMIGAAMLSLPAGVAAKDGDVIRTGSCSGRSDWKLKLSPEDGRIEVEFEIDFERQRPGLERPAQEGRQRLLHGSANDPGAERLIRGPTRHQQQRRQ